MEQFITWYCSEPRLALNRIVVLRFRLDLESLGLAAGTVNQRLAAIRRLAYEAADSGLLSPELAAGIRRVKGVKQLGARTGNWLTQAQAKLLLEKAHGDDLRSLRDLAMISVLIGAMGDGGFMDWNGRVLQQGWMHFGQVRRPEERVSFNRKRL